MRAIILAGGNESLRPLTFTKPKPLIPLINKPIIEHMVEYLQSHYISDISIATDDILEQMIEYFRNEQHVNLSYPMETHPLGTAGSVKNVKYLDETFVVVSGDIITDINLRELIRLHKKSGGLLTIALSPVKDTNRFGIAELEGDGKIIRFFEKPAGKCYSDLANTGIYVIEPEAMDYIPGGYFDFAEDHFPILIKKGDIFGYVTDKFWVDIGHPDDYARAIDWKLGQIRKNVPPNLNCETFNNVSIGEQSEIGNSIIMGPTVIGDDVIIKDNCFIGPYTCVGNGANIDEYSSIQNSVLFEDVFVGKRSRIGGCFVGEYTVIGENAKINDATVSGYCKLGRAIEIANGSNIWPFTTIPPSSIIDGDIKRFVQSSMSGDFLRILPEEESFYFNMQKGRSILSTGFVANGIEEFVNILKKVDQRSIDYHLKGNFNSFAQWIRCVFKEDKLAEKIDEVDENDKRSRKKLIEMMSSHITKKRANTVDKIVDEINNKEVIKGENCTA